MILFKVNNLSGKLATYIESSLPIGTGMFGPPQTETATAPPKAIISAHDTKQCKIHTS